MSDKLHTMIECEACFGTGYYHEGDYRVTKFKCKVCNGTGVRTCLE